MMALFVIAVFVVLFLRWRFGHRHRRSIELGANVAAMQPLTPWTARFARYPTGRVKRRRRDFR
jgi:hypothetical protein